MKAILLQQAEVTSISARRDRSIRFSTETGELTDEHRAAFLALQGTNCRILIEPQEAVEEPIEVKSDKEQKTPSQRLRSVLYVAFSKGLFKSGEEDFQAYYSRHMDRICSKWIDLIDAGE